MSFRDRLLASLRALRPVLEVDGVLVVGSEVPNLLEPDAASTLVVSQDLDVAIPVVVHPEVVARLGTVALLAPSADEPSVWLPRSPGMLEVNFVGLDPRLVDPGEAYVAADPILPLLVFGALSLLRPGPILEVGGARFRLPRPAGMVLEKLLTDRSGAKGERDLLVALGTLLHATVDDLDELVSQYRELPPEHRYAVRSNLTVLSLLRPVGGMPDPEPSRAEVADLLGRLEASEDDRG